MGLPGLGRLQRIVGLVTLSLMLGACAAELRPGPGTLRVGGRGQGAAAETLGVRIVARAGAWRSSPASLELVVTPILIAIENESAAPLRVRYANFALVGPAGQRFAPRAPFEVEGYVSELLPGYASPRPVHPGFYVLRDAPGRAVVFDPFWYDPLFDAWRWASVALPTADMVQMALPERVVEPHGRATGFVYFERVRKVARVDFTARLVDDRSGEPLATLTIPFVLE
jgi:hypothetical protein